MLSFPLGPPLDDPNSPFTPSHKKKNLLNRLFRNKLIVTKHQSQQTLQQHHQTNNPLVLLAAEDTLYGQSQLKHHQSMGDASESEANDCLSDSTIEKMRLQVRMQREKVEDER
jgi:hypothetical protein